MSGCILTPIVPGHEAEVVLHQVHVEILAGCRGGGDEGHVAVCHDGAVVDVRAGRGR